MKKGKEKVIYFGDPMLTMFTDSLEEEFEIVQDRMELDADIRFENVTYAEIPPFDQHFNILFFDWGGATIGNNMLESFCVQIIKHSKEHPSRFYVMASTFTGYAMKDAKDQFKGDLPNIFLSVKEFAKYYKNLPE